MEGDDEVKGEGNHYTTHFRQLDVRVGRWFSIDPKVTDYESPYLSMGGNPILHNDPLGDKIKWRNSDGSKMDRDDRKALRATIKELRKDESFNELYKTVKKDASIVYMGTHENDSENPELGTFSIKKWDIYDDYRDYGLTLNGTYGVDVSRTGFFKFEGDISISKSHVGNKLTVAEEFFHAYQAINMVPKGQNNRDYLKFKNTSSVEVEAKLFTALIAERNGFKKSVEPVHRDFRTNASTYLNGFKNNPNGIGSQISQDYRRFQNDIYISYPSDAFKNGVPARGSQFDAYWENVKGLFVR